MRRLSILLCCLLFLATPGSGSELRLLNGDRVTGRYVRQEGGVSFFQVDWREDPIGVPSRFVGTVSLPGGEPPEGLPARVTLHNGDVFQAALSELAEDRLGMQTSWSPSFSLPTRRIARIEFSQGNGGPVFNGPGALDQWNIGEVPQSGEAGPAVDEVSGGLSFLLPVKLERKLPRVDGAFKLEWTLDATSPHVQYAFQIGGITRDGAKPLSHSFTISANTLYYRLIDRNNRSVDTWRLISRERSLLGARSTTFRLTVDPVEGGMAFWVDGLRLHEWRDGFLAASDAEAFRPEFGLHVTRLEGAVVFESLRMFRIHGPPGEDAGEVEPHLEHTRLVLRNGDVLEGELRGVGPEGVRLVHHATGAELLLPPDRIAQLLMPCGNPELPLKHNRDVVLRAHQGTDRLTVRLLGADAEQLSFQLDGVGEVQRFPMAGVESLVFNPYLETRHDDEPFRERGGVMMIE